MSCIILKQINLTPSICQQNIYEIYSLLCYWTVDCYSSIAQGAGLLICGFLGYVCSHPIHSRVFILAIVFTVYISLLPLIRFNFFKKSFEHTLWIGTKLWNFYRIQLKITETPLTFWVREKKGHNKNIEGLVCIHETGPEPPVSGLEDRKSPRTTACVKL